MNFIYFFTRPELIENILYVFSFNLIRIKNIQSIISNTYVISRKISCSKTYSLAVFNSHWCCVADTNLLLFLIGSTDQLDRFCRTVSRLFGFWLNASLRPRGKQKPVKNCPFVCGRENLVAARGDYDGLFVLRCVCCGVWYDVIWCVLFCSAFLYVFCVIVMPCDVLWCVTVAGYLHAWMHINKLLPYPMHL